MPRFDAYRNLNARATHPRVLDVQSDLVRKVTRWCVPLLQATDGLPVMTRAQQRVHVAGHVWLLDTPNILAVPAALLRNHAGRLGSDEQLLVETSIDFLLRA